MKVDVIVPTLRPGPRFIKLVEELERQTLRANRIIVMNTDQAEWEQCVDTADFLKRHPEVLLTHLSKREFDHGKTRNEGVARSDADYFICMTQDALPADEHLVENLVGAIAGREDVAAAYGRQLAEGDCNMMERYTRQFNYPALSRVKGKEDMETLGIKTFFCSNVCAAYRRDIFDRLGGFVPKTIFNEDMIYAARAVKAGWKIAYAADAQVIHSHNYTALQQFQRNFDLGVSHAQYPEIFADVPPEGEGLKLVKKTAAFLLKRNPLLLPKLFLQSGAKFTGYRMGKKYEKLPMWLVKKCSMQKGYWFI